MKVGLNLLCGCFSADEMASALGRPVGVLGGEEESGDRAVGNAIAWLKVSFGANPGFGDLEVDRGAEV